MIAEYYSHIKALHIIFIVTWFSGMFYIGRLFIYYTEAEDKKDILEKEIIQKQLKIMMYRLWYFITWPSAVITLILGVTLLISHPELLTRKWIHIKFTILVFLYIYHFLNQKLYSQLKNNIVKYSSFKLRIWNEIATLFLFSIVFLAILKNTVSVYWSLSTIVLLSILLFLLIKLFRKKNK